MYEDRCNVCNGAKVFSGQECFACEGHGTQTVAEAIQHRHEYWFDRVVDGNEHWKSPVFKALHCSDVEAQFVAKAIAHFHGEWPQVYKIGQNHYQFRGNGYAC